MVRHIVSQSVNFFMLVASSWIFSLSSGFIDSFLLFRLLYLDFTLNLSHQSRLRFKKFAVWKKCGDPSFPYVFKAVMGASYSWKTASAKNTLVFSKDNGFITLSLSLWAIFIGLPSSISMTSFICEKFGYVVIRQKLNYRIQ